MNGEAMDITSMACGKENCKSNLDMFHWIKDNLEFDQLIWEFGKEPKWLHVSFNKDNNRQQVLVTKKRGVYYTY